MKLSFAKGRISNRMIHRIGALLLLLLLCFQASPARAEQMEKVGESRYETQPVTRTLAPKRYGSLSFTSSSYVGGRVSIRVADRPNTVITYRKSLKAGSRSQAERFSEYIDFHVEELENEIAVSVETSSRPPWSGTDYSANALVEIETPRDDNLKIDVRTTLFTIDISGSFASVDVSNTLGDVTVEKIVGKVSVSCENGAVSVQNCTGPASVSTSSRPIVLRQVDGKLGSIRLRNANGKITLESVRGEIDARTENASIVGDDIRFESGRSILSTGNANITVDASIINGDLNIHDANGKIELALPANTSASYSLRVEEGGRIYTKRLPITVEQATRRLVYGYSGSGHNKIQVDMAGVGTIDLEGKPASTISNR